MIPCARIPLAWLATMLISMIVIQPGQSSADDRLLSAQIDKQSGIQAVTAAESGAPVIRVAIKATQELIISSQIRGVISRIRVADGGRFKKNDVLLEMDCAVLETQAERSRAQARRQTLIYESNARLEKMHSKSPLEVAVSKAEADAAEAESHGIKAMLAQCRISAPFDGKVGQLLVKENQFVGEGQPMLELLNDSRLVLEFIVPSNWLSWFKPGYEFDFVVDETGTRHRARLDHLGGRVDPVSQSIKAYAELVKPESELSPGMSGTAYLTVPSQAGELRHE